LVGKPTPHVVVIVSTTNVGDCRRFYDTYFTGCPHSLVYSPEFIRMGEVRKDLENPHLILVGDKDGEGAMKLAGLYKEVVATNPPIHYLQYEEAELAKIGINSFLTIKISFSNTIQAIARVLHIPVDSILEAIGDDPRIGHKYLAPGLGYGGPCLPRDNKNLERLIDVFQDIPLSPKRTLMHAADLTNEMVWTGWAREILSRTRSSEVVGFLGLTYKPHTHLLDESQAYKIYQYIKDSRKVEVFDPNLAQRSTVGSTPELLQKSDLVFVGTPDDLWRGLFYEYPTVDFIDPWYVITE
jgi:UDPglucose 6-dehydrogenase